MAIQNNFSKKEWLAMRLMFSLFLAEALIFSFIIHKWFFSTKSSYALVAHAVAERVYVDELKPGATTEKLVLGLKNSGLKPSLVQEVKRAPFSVKGTLVTLKGDNVEIFEYPDSQSALKDAVAFAQEYNNSESATKWQDMMHIYVRDKVLIFYMGKEPEILATFGTDNQFSLAKL